jgi:hypothetical protein
VESEKQGPGPTSTSSPPRTHERTRFDIARDLCKTNEELLEYFVAITLTELVHCWPALIPARAAIKAQILDFWKARPLVAGTGRKV